MSADDAFFQGLRDFGWMEGQNIFVERRFAAGNIDQLKDSAAELVHLKVDVIVTAATAATQAAKDATASIPIVFINVIRLARGSSRAWRILGETLPG
jgi:putative tryptophan/tyrosine transport system substrate-binding protein